LFSPPETILFQIRDSSYPEHRRPLLLIEDDGIPDAFFGDISLQRSLESSDII